jgi:predicted NAD-dependent protein-ADP-ribosyltransferase YbiA (DUF1768 family)
MIESGSSIGVLESGNKVGTLINKSDYYGEVNENSIHTLNIQDLKIQVDISPKKNKWEVLFGSQIRKLITQNAVNAGKEFKNEEDYNEFLKLINDLVEIESANLAESLGVSLDRLREGDLDRDAWGKLIDIFKQSAIEREESDNVIYGLDYLKSQELTIDALPSRNKIQNLMNALLNNRILKQKMFGRSYVQTSSVGFEYATEESLSKALRNGDILEDSEFYKSHFVNKKFDNTKARLGFVNKVDDEIYVAEILLPNWFKGKFNINTLDSNLLESLGYRIPTQGLNSMLSFKVVGFLPKNTDLLAAVPYEITVQSGGDFDVDKLNMFLYNYITDMSEEKIKEYNKIKNTITDDEILDLFIKNNEKPLPIPLGGDLGRRFEKKRLQNKLLTLLIKRLKDPERFVDYVTPNSAENLQKQAQEINNAQQEKYKVTVDYKGIKQFWTGTNVRVGKNFWSAKAGVGQSASQSVFAALTQISPLVQKVYSNRLFVPKGYLNLNEDNKIILGKKNNTEGKSIIDLIGNQHLSANVDAAKTPFIFQLNANGKTNDIHYYLLEAGIPDKWVNRFMTQPIILEFIKKTAENKGLVSKYRRVNLAENKTKNDIILEVRKMFGGEGVDSEYLKANVDFNGKRIPTANPEGRIYDEEQLLSFIKKPINSSQLNILDDYLFYTEYAMDLRKAINSLKFDTQGAGKNLPESMIYDYNYKKLNDNIFDGIYTLVDKTIIRPFKVNVLDTAIALYKPSVAVHKIFNSDIALKSLMNILDKNSQLKSESLYKIYGMLTNIIIQNNLQNKKEWFDNNVYGDNSVSKQISKLIKSDEMKGNYLFDNMLIVDFAQTQGKPDIVRFDNTIRIDNNLDKVINESFRDFKFKHPALYTDLIKLSLFQTGVIESPVSFYKYIPVEDFVEVVGNLTKNSLVEYPDMIEKVIQNLPTLKGLANKISYSKILEGRIGLPDYLEIQYNNNPESYITKFDFKLNELGLYKLNSINEESLSYYRIPITGASNLYNGIIGDDVDVKAKFDNDEETDTQEETERPTSKSSTSTFPVKPGVEELFNTNPELANIGTQEEYSQYLDSVFPNSQVKDIVYHGSPNKFDKFKIGDIGYHFGTKQAAKDRIENVENPIIYNVILNINNIAKISDTGTHKPDYIAEELYNKGLFKKYPDLKYDIMDSQIVHEDKIGYDLIRENLEVDGLMYINEYEDKGSESFIVFEPEQIHILGNKQDIEGFKKFTEKPDTQEESDNMENLKFLPNKNEKINIYAGSNENADLSNFAIRPFTINVETSSGNKQYTFQSVEQGFHFHKAVIANNSQIAAQILKTTNGGTLRNLTNRNNLKLTPEQVKEWDNTSKSIMLNLMYDSYIQNPQAAQKLLTTGNAIITHTQDNTRWKTDFPQVVMTVRDMLREESQNLKSQLTWDSLSEDDKFGIERAGISPEEFEDMTEKQKDMAIECYGSKKINNYGKL